MTGEFVAIPKFGKTCLAVEEDAQVTTCDASNLGTQWILEGLMKALVKHVKINQIR